MSDQNDPVSDDIRHGFARRLEQLKGDKSERAFAKEVGISPTALHQYLKGQSDPGMSNLLRIASKCAVTVSWLITGEGGETAQADDAYVPVPVLPEAVSAGGGREASANDGGASDHVLFRREFLRSLSVNPQKAALLTVRGDSMEPTLSSGDLILADTGDQDISTAGVFVISVDGSAMVKRLMRRGDGSVMVISDNQQLYPPEIVTAGRADLFRVIGRVRWYGRAVR